MKSILLLLPLLILAGCATSLPPKYTVTEHASVPLAEVDTSVLTVRMAKDLRAYATPLCFNADNTVVEVSDLTYYAPLEVAIERALNDVTQKTGTSTRPLRITVQDFCVDKRGDEPVAKVTLEARGNYVTKVAALSPDYTTIQLRDALGELLLQSYAELLKTPLK